MVKKYETGVIRNPITIAPTATVRELIALTHKHNISGVPVVDGGELVGIVTSRDIRFETQMDVQVSTIMTPRTQLITAPKDASSDTITQLLHKHRIEKILLIDANRLCGMVTVKDIQKSRDYPNACKDTRGQLRVGASVGVSDDTEARVESLLGAGADIIVVDTAHGHSKGVLDRVRWIKKSFKGALVMGGNIATAEAARSLADAGADALKVGIGPGSICTTRVVTGVGIPQISAISDVANAVHREKIPIIADGGIRYSGDIAKAICAGADCVMVGSLLAGTDEAPGQVEIYQGQTYKTYRGMGSHGAMIEQFGSSDRYFQDSAVGSGKLVPEGIEGRVPYRGSIHVAIHQLMGGLRAAMGYTGCASIAEMRSKPLFNIISPASQTESHVHDVSISKEAPNYPGH